MPSSSSLDPTRRGEGSPRRSPILRPRKLLAMNTHDPASIPSRGEAVEFVKTADGNLRILLTAEGRREAWPDIVSLRDEAGINAAFLALIEPELSGVWEVIRPEEIGALTSSLILSDEAERDDHGRLIRVGRVYWNPDYAVTDEVEALDERGFIEFAGVG